MWKKRRKSGRSRRRGSGRKGKGGRRKIKL